MKYIAGEQLQYTAMNTLKSRVDRKKWCALKVGRTVELDELKVGELLKRNLITVVESDVGEIKDGN